MGHEGHEGLTRLSASLTLNLVNAITPPGGGALYHRLMWHHHHHHVQVGNAAGTATCLVAGGGNEKPGVVVATPAGALATFTVSGLGQLKQVWKCESGVKFQADVGS